MKGLIRKDLYSVRFQIIVGFLIMLVPNIVNITSTFTLPDVGASAAETFNEMARLSLCAIINYINICLFSSFILNTLSSEISTGWNKLRRTFPISGRNIVGAKLISTYIIIGVLTLTSMCFNIAAGIVQGLNMEFLIACPICIGMLQVMLMSPLFPLSLCIGSKYTNALYLGAELVAFFALTAVAMLTIELDEPLAAFRLEFYLGLPLLSALSATLSFLSGSKAVKRLNA